MRKKSTGLTRREIDTLNSIKSFMLKYNVTPTIREICDDLNIKSTSSAHMHFKRLIELGYIIPHGDNSLRYSVKGLKIVEVQNEES